MGISMNAARDGRPRIYDEATLKRLIKIWKMPTTRKRLHNIVSISCVRASNHSRHIAQPAETDFAPSSTGTINAPALPTLMVSYCWPRLGDGAAPGVVFRLI